MSALMSRPSGMHTYIYAKLAKVSAPANKPATMNKVQNALSHYARISQGFTKLPETI